MILPTSLTIRDSIHSYIDLTPLEHLILDTKTMQRLRHIKQNAFSFYTYPTCQTTRFEHSLGVLKIGYIILESILNNSQENTVKEFLSDFEYMINFYEGKEVYKNKDISIVKKDLIEGMRLACLLHDIGHFPFSHLSETIFNESLDDKFLLEKNPYSDKEFMEDWLLVNSGHFALKLHELTTYLLLKENKEINVIINENERYKRLFNLALAILNPQKELLGKIKTENAKFNKIESTIYPLRVILDSEIDADRFDYLTRDSVNSSVTSGDFDIERILRTMILCKLSQKKLYYYVCPSVKSLSSIESFFIERTKAYNWLIYHHNCVFYNRLCSFILRKLIDKESVLYQINNFKEIILRPEVFHYRNFNKSILIDDVYVLEKLHILYKRTVYIYEQLTLDEEFRNTEKDDNDFLLFLTNKFNQGDALVTNDLKRIITYFEILLFRKRNKLSLLKSISDYEEVDCLFKKGFDEYLENFYAGKKIESVGRRLRKTKDLFNKEDFVLNQINDRYLSRCDAIYSVQKYFLTKIQYDLNKEGVIFIDSVNFEPIKMEKDRDEAKLRLYCPAAKDELKSVNRLSPLLEALPRYKHQRINLFAFLILIDKKKPLERKDINKIRLEAKKRFVRSLLRWLTTECKQFKNDFEIAQEIR